MNPQADSGYDPRMKTDPDHSKVVTLTIAVEEAGQRVDNFLLKTLKGVPKSHVYRILRKGEVRVNKGRIKAEYRLNVGDLLRIPPIRVAERESPQGPHPRAVAEIEATILYEDNRLLVLNKPSGVAVHGGSGVSFGVIELLRASRPDAPFLELCHRLDRDTSGCLVLAKRRSALRAFQELMREDKVDKRYLALVRGEWSGGKRYIDAPLRKNQLASGERMVRVAPDGKPSLSLFMPRECYVGSTLMEVQLITGRTHQVRVHSAHSGHPIAGDDKYGDDDFNREMAAKGLKRLFLHAASLRFQLPEQPPLELHAPLEGALEGLLQRLEKR